jgi:hypothetical protein
VSKYVTKFRKNQNYDDDYNYAGKFVHGKPTKLEYAEIKRKKRQWAYEAADNNDDDFDEYDYDNDLK